MSEAGRQRDLNIAYDEAQDIVTIAGVKYSGELFRGLGFGPIGSWLRIDAREDGVITVFAAPQPTGKV